MTEKVKDENIDLDDDYFEDEDTQKDKYLTFRIADEDYAIEIRYVIEINRIQKITEVPDTENFVKGVINLRGKIIPVIDVRLRFGLEERAYDDRTCIIVVNMNDVLTGLIVDRVNEVLDMPEDTIDPAPQAGKRRENRYIQGMGKVEDEVKMILDVNSLLHDDIMEELKEMAENK